MSPLIDVLGLVKVYPDGTPAVDHLTFSVDEGEVFGFLGRNGAGKTTTIRILVTLLARTAGVATIAGFDVGSSADQVRRMIGYAAQFIAVDRDLTVVENLVLQARLQGLRRPVALQRAKEMLEAFELGPVAGRKAAVLSGGTRRRLDLAQALVHRPLVLFLDEPTTGLDPQTRASLWKHLEDLKGDGRTIFLTTQYLEEADRLCDRVVILDKGQIVASGSPSALKEEVGRDVVNLVFDSDSDGQDQLRRAVAAVRGMPGVDDLTVTGMTVSVAMKNAPPSLSDLVRRLDEVGVQLASLTMTRPTLDEVFLRYTGRRMSVEEVLS